MTKRYFVWKDANCNGKNIDWIEMKGKEFTLFKRGPENNHRRFIRLGDPELDEEIIFIGATKQKYDEWNREQAHKKRIEEARKESGYSEVSLSTSLCDDSGETIDIYIADSDCDVEASVLKFIEKKLSKMLYTYLPRKKRNS